MFTKPSHAKPNGYPSFPRPNKQSHSFLLAYLPRVTELNAESHPPLLQKCVHWDARERERVVCGYFAAIRSLTQAISTGIINIQKNKNTWTKIKWLWILVPVVMNWNSDILHGIERERAREMVLSTTAVFGQSISISLAPPLSLADSY